MNDAELTILSLVSEAPRYGYEIQKLVDERGLREWLTIGFSSIYYILNRLERQGVINSRLHTSGGQARKVYEVTEAGRGVLQTAVSDLLRQPRGLGTGFELGLANIHVLKPQQAFRMLSNHREDLQQRLDAVEKMWKQRQQENHTPDNVQALYTHSIAVMRAELDWLLVFLDTWRVRHPGVDDTTVEAPAVNASEASTERHAATVNTDPAKMIQRLKRPSLPRKE
ncbi:MAG: PadR family transcriptional regulator [Anaerolineae bacterium]